LCQAFDGTQTRLFEVNPVTRRLKALSSVNGWFFRRDADGSNGWISGWSSKGSVLLRPSDGKAIRIDGRDGWRASEIALSESVVGAVFVDEKGSTVRLYDREKLGVR